MKHLINETWKYRSVFLTLIITTLFLSNESFAQSNYNFHELQYWESSAATGCTTVYSNQCCFNPQTWGATCLSKTQKTAISDYSCAKGWPLAGTFSDIIQHNAQQCDSLGRGNIHKASKSFQIASDGTVYTSCTIFRGVGSSFPTVSTILCGYKKCYPQRGQNICR